MKEGTKGKKYEIIKNREDNSMNEWVKNKTKGVKKKIINNTSKPKNGNHMVRFKLMNKKKQ